MEWYQIVIIVWVVLIALILYVWSARKRHERKMLKRYNQLVDELMVRSWEELNLIAHEQHDACEGSEDPRVQEFHGHYHNMEAVLMLNQLFGELGDNDKRLLCMTIVTGRKVLEGKS